MPSCPNAIALKCRRRARDATEGGAVPPRIRGRNRPIFQLAGRELFVLGEKGVGNDRAALTDPGGIAALVLDLDIH